MNVAIITGASSGLGKEFALQMCKGLKSIDEFWIIARRKERLESLSEQLKGKAKVIALDLTKEDDLRHFKNILSYEKPVIRVLVNCAGYGILGRFQEGKIEEQLGMIRLNCEALTYITHACIPYMKANSRIIQAASSAAFLPQADFAIYAATKSFVLSFSRALGEELRKQRIYVTAVCPGPVDTEFFDIAQKYNEGMRVKQFIMTHAKDVVQDALLASASRKTVAVYGYKIKALLVFSKILPHSLLLGMTRILH